MADYISQFTGSEIDSRLAKVSQLESGKQDNLVSGTNIKTINGQSVLGGGNITIQAGDTDAVKYVSQELTEAQKAQARANIDAASLEDIQNMDFVTATTLPTASASTMGHIYLIGPDANDNYDRYFTQESSGSYSWVPLGSTEIDLSTYATQAEVSQLEAKVGEISGQFYGVFASASALPSGITVKGYAYVGSEEPFELYTFDGTSWTDTESTVSGVHFSDNELSIGTVVEGATADALVTGNAPYQKLNLTLPKAGNPFKGLWDSLADLKDAITAQSGFYAYVLGTPPATTAKIYLYDSAEVSNKYWKDSGITIDLNDATVKPLSENAKNAIIRTFSKVAWIDENGQQYIDDLANALLMKQVVSINAVFTQGTSVYGTNSDIDSLKENLVVTALYDDGTTGVLADSDYELSGTLERGTSTITVNVDELTDTFTVNVVTYVLEKSQFIIAGLSNAYGTNRDPHYTDPSTNRFVYPYFDLGVTPGKTYEFTPITDVSTIQFSILTYDSSDMTEVNGGHGNISPNGINWTDGLPSIVMTASAGDIVVRINGRKDSNNSTVTVVPIERLIIDEVD